MVDVPWPGFFFSRSLGSKLCQMTINYQWTHNFPREFVIFVWIFVIFNFLVINFQQLILTVMRWWIKETYIGDWIAVPAIQQSKSWGGVLMRFQC
jgi:hypothetical protein